jgi:hypothetical protein
MVVKVTARKRLAWLLPVAILLVAWGCHGRDPVRPPTPPFIGTTTTRMFALPEVIIGLLTVFLRAVETTIRQRSPGAPPAARFGAVAFVHRFGSDLNSHVHFHALVSDGVFSSGTDGEAIFLPAVLDLTREDSTAVRAGTVAQAAEGRLRRRNSHEVVILAPVRHNRVPLQAATPVDVSVNITTASERLLTPEELLDRLVQLVTLPRIHKHRTCGVLASNTRLRQAVTASAGPAGATLQLLLPTRIYECLLLSYPKCGKPMRIIEFVLERPVIGRILAHIGEPTRPPAVRPARPLPQGGSVRPDARPRRLAGDGPDNGAGRRPGLNPRTDHT